MNAHPNSQTNISLSQKKKAKQKIVRRRRIEKKTDGFVYYMRTMIANYNNIRQSENQLQDQDLPKSM